MLRRRLILTGVISIGAVFALLLPATFWGQTPPWAPPKAPPVVAEPAPTPPDDLADTGDPSGTTDPGTPPSDPPPADPRESTPVIPTLPVVQIDPPIDPPADPPVDPPADPPADPPVDPPVDPPADPPVDPPVDPPAVRLGAHTIVSLSFDDSDAGQVAGAGILASHGLEATYFANSGSLGLPGKLTLAQLQAIAAQGNEVGGHSVTHPDLTALPADEVKRQVCNDRAQLAQWGFSSVRSFAYPFAEVNAGVEQIVSDCGYNSGRMLGDINSRFGCFDCDYAESTPPADPFYTKALDQFDNTWTLQDLKNGVLNAELRGGGWVQYTFHDVCTTSCDELAIPQTMLNDFASWLALRSLIFNTDVRTIGDVIGGAVKPVVMGPVVPPPGSGNGVVNPGLEAMTNGVPACWSQASWGDNDAVYSLVNPGHSGSVASQVVITNYVSGEGKLIPTLDLGACAPSVLEGHQYSLRGWYTSTTVTQFAVYLRTTTGGWVYWTSSPWFGSAEEYSLAAWTTPAIPPGYTGISFGLSLFSPGVLVTDDYEMFDVASAPPVITPDPATEVVNPSLETMSNGVPACWTSSGWGDNDATFSVVNPGRTGDVAGQISITNYVSGEGKLIPTLDLGTCAPSVAEGHEYQLNGWYKSSTVTQFAVYLRTTAGDWQYWTSSPWFGAASEYTEASWTTPAIPAGYTGISFGLNIFNPGTIVTDDYSITDVTPAPPAALMVEAAPPVGPGEAPAAEPVVTEPPAATPAQDPPVTEEPPASPEGEGSAPPADPAPEPAPAVEPEAPPTP